jgi:hypothetical protein
MIIDVIKHITDGNGDIEGDHIQSLGQVDQENICKAPF